jgi:glycosyltransferase involved in cell wall biosynthesis
MKYSIIIPARNGAKYLPTCIATIIDQQFEDYELIVSDDHSTDSTGEFLKNISHPKVKIIIPPEGLSMAEHWEWALKHASGEWLLFIGQDDGVQAYFFKLAEKLTKLAVQKNIRTIMSQRAYYFWKGCEKIYGNIAVSYSATPFVKTRNGKLQSLLALLGYKTYFELPEMYTTSLFKREIIEDAQKIQNGSLFVTHPQDANLAAIACSLDDRFLYSGIPLGWVGTSPKSAGMAVNIALSEKPEAVSDKELSCLRKEYLQKTNQSKLKTHPLAGDFSFGSCAVYFWGALLQTINLRKGWFNALIQLQLFKIIMFAGVLIDIKKTKANFKSKFEIFNDILTLNNCSLTIIKIVSIFIKITFNIYTLGYALDHKLRVITGNRIVYQQSEITMTCASLYIENENKIKCMIEDIG